MTTAQALLSLALSISAVIAVGLGLVRHLVKHYLSELLPDDNGNHNLRGRVERIEQRVDKIYELLLEERLSR